MSLDLCSTVLWRRLEPVEQLRSPADLARWRAEAGLGESRAAVTGADLADARDLREAIYRLMLAHIGGARLPARDLVTVNAAARRPCRTPRLGAGGELSWEPGEPISAALSTVARDAIELIGGPWAGRIRQCAARDCAFLFVDTSRPGSRRWCAMNRCGNREHVRKFRSQPRQPDGHDTGGQPERGGTGTSDQDESPG